MKELCISIDVSKGESHVGSYIDSVTIYRKVFVIKHDAKGFQQIRSLHDEMKEKHQNFVVLDDTLLLLQRQCLLLFDASLSFHHVMI